MVERKSPKLKIRRQPNLPCHTTVITPRSVKTLQLSEWSSETQTVMFSIMSSCVALPRCVFLSQSTSVLRRPRIHCWHESTEGRREAADQSGPLRVVNPVWQGLIPAADPKPMMTPPVPFAFYRCLFQLLLNVNKHTQTHKSTKLHNILPHYYPNFNVFMGIWCNRSAKKKIQIVYHIFIF